MKPLFVLPHDYYAACLHQLEQSRGHLFTEDEYRALRRETLDDLATLVRRPVGGISAALAMFAACAGGALVIKLGNMQPWLLLALSVAAFVIGALSFALLRGWQYSGCFSIEQRLRMLDSLRERQLVSKDEAARIAARLELAHAA